MNETQRDEERLLRGSDDTMDSVHQNDDVPADVVVERLSTAKPDDAGGAFRSDGGWGE